jgi:hypothetical protein
VNGSRAAPIETPRYVKLRHRFNSLAKIYPGLLPVPIHMHTNEEHLQIRTSNPRRVRDLTAVHAAGQSHVGNEQIDRKRGLKVAL